MSRRKVLLVGWDSADWKVIQPLLDRGEMPALAGIVEGGVSGNLASIQPMLSPILWNSIATGKRPYKHGVYGFTEVDPHTGQPTPVSSATRRCQSLWQILNRQGLRTQVVGWFATHPAEPLNGACVSDRFAAPVPRPGQPWPLAKGTVHPAALGDTLAGLRVRPEELDGGLLKLFVPRAAEINQAHDGRLGVLATHLAESFSFHAAATHLLEHESWDFAAVYYRAIDWLSHHFMGFHPPMMDGTHESEFEMYRDVVNGAYRLHDAMLGRLLQLAGPETTVLIVSDHGFHCDHLRPRVTPDVPAGIAEWHRPSGILAMRGAGLRTDELIHGASLMDITPTVLAMYGLPTARDMDGRVLAEAFAEPPESGAVETWEPAATDGEDAKADAAPSAGRAGEDGWSVIKQFAALGYLDDPGDDPAEAAAATRRENDWSLARAYLDAGRFLDALPLLETVHDQWPERWDFSFTLARCQLNLNLLAEAVETAGDLLGGEANAANRLLLANIEFHRGNFPACLEHIAAAEADAPDAPALLLHLGRARLLLRQWEAAEAAYQSALAINPDEPLGHVGLAHCHLHAKRFEAAAEAALTALGLRYDLPLAHFHLGIALARLGETLRAIQAFETALRYRPHWLWPQRFLTKLHAHQPGGEARAQMYQERVRSHFQQSSEIRARHERWLSESAERARLRASDRIHRRAGQSPVIASLALEASAPAGKAAEPMDFLIVSGLPRSGTSLMMQMLVAGGLEAMRDDLRPADEDNERGYYEWQEIKRLPKDPRLIEKAHGKVTKVISALLPWLPRAHRFRVIFMVRSPEEVAASQEKMQTRLAGQAAGARSPTTRAEIVAGLSEHRRRILEMLRASPNVELLEVGYDSLLADPDGECAKAAAFAGVGAERIAAMASVVAPELRHFQSAAPTLGTKGVAFRGPLLLIPTHPSV